MYIKTFGGYPDQIEEEVNAWLAQNPTVKVLQMTQSSVSSEDSWMIVVTFLFELN